MAHTSGLRVGGGLVVPRVYPLSRSIVTVRYNLAACSYVRVVSTPFVRARAVMLGAVAELKLAAGIASLMLEERSAA